MSENPWDHLPEVGETNPNTGKPYKLSKEQRWKTLRVIQSESYRAAHSVKMKEVNRRPGHSEKMSAAVRAGLARVGRLAKPKKKKTKAELAAARERGRQAQRAAWKDPAKRQEAAERVRALWRDPAYRAKVEAGLKRRRATCPTGLSNRLNDCGLDIYILGNKDRPGVWKIGSGQTDKRLAAVRREGYAKFCAPEDDVYVAHRVFCEGYARRAELAAIDSLPHYKETVFCSLDEAKAAVDQAIGAS